MPGENRDAPVILHPRLVGLQVDHDPGKRDAERGAKDDLAW